MTTALIAALAIAASSANPATVRAFTVVTQAEVVATIAASCAPCDWSAIDREAAVLELAVDGTYSQHLVLARGSERTQYSVMLGTLQPGRHELWIRRDEERSANQSNSVSIGSVDIRIYTDQAPEYTWLARAPFLRARPGSLERFSDVPLLAYVETDVQGEAGRTFRHQYTVIFSNEDGGTPVDRLMATWGRTTDIEFVYGIAEPDDHGASREVIQVEGHRWIDFAGPHVAAHPVLWVATDNNMVADHGADDLVWFAPMPQPVRLGESSREAVMDQQFWTYAVTSAEMRREGRIDVDPRPGSGRIVDPRRYAVIEACADIEDATLAFDVGVRGADKMISWYSSDRGDPTFRIARTGCFRAGAPLPATATVRQIVALRVRGQPRPARNDAEANTPQAPRLRLRRVNRVFMLDARFRPAVSPVRWSGELSIPLDDLPVEVAFGAVNHRRDGQVVRTRK